MNDYSRLTRTELIERLAKLEAGGSVLQYEHEESIITERKAAAAALKDSEERLQAILRTAVEGIITIDERGHIESMNPAAERIFGYKTGEVVGRNINILMPSPYREKHDGYLADYRNTGHAKIIGIGREVVGRRKDGSVFPMDLAVSEVRLANQRLFTGFVRDITERKQLENEILKIAEQERQRIGQDLHDGICQHLAGIELMSQALERKLARKSKTEALQAARIAEYVRSAISQTRMLARGLSPVALESEGLMAALQELASNTSELFKVKCRWECEALVAIQDNTTATHLYRIAQEAVANAIKHGGAKQIVIRLARDREGFVLAVHDDGKGLPTNLVQSKGMGLRIMQYRAGMIGGSLTVQQETRGGTTVRCSIPQPATASVSSPSA